MLDLKNTIKYGAAAGLVAVLLLLLVYPVFDARIDSVEAADSALLAGLTAGTLQVGAPGSALLSETDLNSIPDTAGAATGVLSGVEVKDHRASAPGWSVTITCHNFDSGTEKIPVTEFTITPGAITPTGNSVLSGVSEGSEHTFSGPSDPATLMSAANGSGRGRFSQNIDLSLAIDVATAPSLYSTTCVETVS